MLSMPVRVGRTSCAAACLKVKIFEAMRPLGASLRVDSLMSEGDSALATRLGTILRNLSPCWITATPLRASRVSRASSASSRVAVSGSDSE